MADLGFYHRIHGDKLHDTMRFLIARHVVINGGKVKDMKVFKDRACSCEPDLYYEFPTKRIDGNKRRRMVEIYVAEVETTPSKESIRKKYEQYKETLTGLTDLIVLDMNKDFLEFVSDLTNVEVKDLSPRVYDDLTHLEAFVKWRIPI